MVVKERPDGTKKYRIIWDLRDNKVNLLVHQGERVVLPRLWEAINDALALSASCEEGETISWVALDISDAFNNIPVRHSEIKFTCCSLHGKFYAFTRHSLMILERKSLAHRSRRNEDCLAAWPTLNRFIMRSPGLRHSSMAQRGA